VPSCSFDFAMDIIPELVPTLAELIEASEDWGFQCRWHNQKKGSQNVKRCGNNVRGRDVRERDDLIDRLRFLIRSAREPATLGVVTPDRIREIRETLEKISMWLLCKGKHRKYSNKVLLKWSEELNKVEVVIGQPATDQPATDQPETYDIREALNIDKDEKSLCHGKKRDGTRCTRLISAGNRGLANEIIATLANARHSLSTTRNYVLELAKLLICQGNYHRDQVIGKSEEWFRKIQELFPLADAVPEQPSTPVSSRTTTVDSETPISTASSIFSRAGSIATSTPPTNPPTQRRYNTRSTASGSPLRSKSTNATATIVDDEPPYLAHPRATRSATFERLAGLLTPKPVYPHFMPLSPKKSSAFLTNLYNMITRAFKKREEAPGYLYGFKRDGGDYIKVGFTTKSVEGRIQEWERQCNQRVTVVLQKHVSHAGKMESLVHAALYNQRRREALVNGACNNGRGCHKKHREWIEVTLEVLREVVRRWIRWFKCIPYDEQGCLKSEWVGLIYKLRKEQKKPLPDLWHHWIDVTGLAEGTSDEVKTERVDDKSTLAFDAKTEAVDENSTLPIDDKEKTKTVITTTEIKIEPNDEVAADNLVMGQEFRDINRGYIKAITEAITEAITVIKNETPDGTPLPEYPIALQDLPLDPDDPFVASPVTTVPE
jgi:hypothetical protein